MQILMGELSGAQLIHDMGYLDSGLTSSPAMMVLCDELASMARFISRGIEVNDKTLALDVIHEVGPGNNFLTHDHTVKNFRQALWFPQTIFRGNVQTWQAEGGKDMTARLRERARSILAEHRVPALPKAVQKQIAEILANRGKA